MNNDRESGLAEEKKKVNIPNLKQKIMSHREELNLVYRAAARLYLMRYQIGVTGAHFPACDRSPGANRSPVTAVFRSTSNGVSGPHGWALLISCR